jgi:ABC-2 type transport system ATP-binding protein
MRAAVSMAIETRALRKVYAAPKLKKRRSGAPPPPGSLPSGPPRPPGSPIVALDGLDLSVPTGQFFGLLGPNGAGKTTTIGILTTRVLPSGGQALIGGEDVVARAVAVRRRIGVVPQRPNADRGLSVLENLIFHAAYFGFSRAVARRRAEEILARMGLGDRGEARVEHLSGGQQQRLMIARALIHEPEILFLDEPTVGLDPQARLALWEILRALHTEGRTIVMTTHYMEEAEQLCDRVAIVDRGRLLACDAPAELRRKAPGGTLIEISLDGPADSTLAVYHPGGGEAVAPLIGAVQAAGRRVTNIRLAPPSLETLFVSLTGRKLD